MKQTTYLADYFFSVASIALLFGLVATLSPPLFPFAAGVWPIIFIWMLWDFSRLFRPKEIYVKLETSRTVGLGENLELEISVYVNRTGIIPESLKLFPPPSRCIDFPETELIIPRAQSADSAYHSKLTFRAARLGFEKINSVQILYYSPFRLWSRKLLIPIAPVSYRVIPQLKRMPEQHYRELRSQSRLLYQGSRRLLRSQSADQFHSIRKYQFPDPIRHIDPRKTAKFGTLMTRTFDSFFDHHIVIGLDVGRAMEGQIAGQPKQEFYLASALAIAENAVQSRDRVSLFSFSQKIHHVVKSSKQMQHFRPVFEGAPAFQPREEESDYSMLSLGLQMVAPQRAIVVLFTDVSKPSVQEALEKSLDKVGTKHLCLIASVIDEDHALEPTLESVSKSPLTLDGLGRVLYSSWLSENTKDFRWRIGSRGAGMVQVPHTYWMSAVNRLYAELRRSARL